MNRVKPLCVRFSLLFCLSTTNLKLPPPRICWQGGSWTRRRGEAMEAGEGDDGRLGRGSSHDQREDVGLLHLKLARGKKGGGG